MQGVPAATRQEGQFRLKNGPLHDLSGQALFVEFFFRSIRKMRYHEDFGARHVLEIGLGKISVRVNGADCGIEAIILGLFTSIGGFLFGYDTGQISSMLLFEDFIQRFGQTQADGTKAFDDIISSLIVSLMSIGTLVGALSGAYTADWWGRRRSPSFGVLIFIIGNVIQITAMYSWVHLTMGRLIAGLGVGNLSVGVPMFQSECCPREIPGSVVASYQLMMTIEILVSNGINMGDRFFKSNSASRRIVIGLGIGFSLPLGIGILSLQRIECFTGQPSSIPRLVYRTMLGCAIHFLQQWTSVNYFFYVNNQYGATIFNSAGIEDPVMVQLILGAVNVITTFPGLYISVWLLILASIGVARPPTEYASSGVMMIVAACMFIASFAMTWGPFAWVVIDEKFRLRTRAKQASLATAFNWLGNFLIGFLTPFANSGIGYAFGFVFFGTNLAAAFLVYFFLFETKALFLENVDAMKTRDPVYWNRRSSILNGPAHDGMMDRSEKSIDGRGKGDASLNASNFPTPQYLEKLV
ncbi:and other transporter-domain-containing protein [Clohesyomyces aquaticus]|uniref:And other transporter-domain-containing protein n=1 Tax=Clohesyomyces aquaticus TaxID=1231657 RepID=A0A1Y1YT99_9PLEO|nr:and other transporter-domain-containing protein [Clohesyomyces aquaticus]